MYEKIMIAITNDEKKEKLTAKGLELAMHYNSEVVFVHINQMVVPIDGMHTNPPVIVESLDESYLEGQIKHFSSVGVKEVSGHILEDTSASMGLLKQVNKYKPDLLLIGNNKHHSLGEKLLGTASNYVVKHAECDTLIIK